MDKLRAETEQMRTRAYEANRVAFKAQDIMMATPEWQAWRLEMIVETSPVAFQDMMATPEWQDWNAKEIIADKAFHELYLLERSLRKKEVFTRA